jgi:light-harvesting complex II chlorophyll a/b binding protein 5
MAAMATLKTEFLGQSVVAPTRNVAAKAAQGEPRVVALFQRGKKAAEKAAAPVKKAAAQVKKAAPAQVKKAAPAQVKKVANRVNAKVNKPDNEELAKWYGPDRRIYLPEGLLAKDEIPAYLTGEVPGDYGYDPFGLSKKPEDFDRYQAYELIHARWAMLGAAGFVLPEAFNKFGAVCGPEAVWWKTGALLLEGDSIQYFGATIPVNLAAAVIAEVVLVGGAEYYRSTNKSPLGSDLDRLHPGGAFDPLGLANDPDQFALLKVKEIKNGRLAMFSMLGFFIQAYVTGEGPVENLSAHLSDPFGNNLLTVIQGSAERVPSL